MDVLTWHMASACSTHSKNIAAIGSIDEWQSVVGIRAKAFVQVVLLHTVCRRGIAIVLPVLAYNQQVDNLHFKTPKVSLRVAKTAFVP